MESKLTWAFRSPPTALLAGLMETSHSDLDLSAAFTWELTVLTFSNIFLT